MRHKSVASDADTQHPIIPAAALRSAGLIHRESRSHDAELQSTRYSLFFYQQLVRSPVASLSYYVT